MQHEHPPLKIKEVIMNSKNKHLFRQIARDSSGEIFEPPEGEAVFMAYQTHPSQGQELVGVGSCLYADMHLDEPGMPFDSEYFHLLSYLFIKSRYKSLGYGSKLLYFMESQMLARGERPIRVQAAEKAMDFFNKHSYQKMAEPMDTVCGGSPLFSRLCNMQKG